MTTLHEPFPAAHFIKEIGRGKKGARSLSRDDAQALYGAMLDGRVSDLELGAHRAGDAHQGRVGRRDRRLPGRGRSLVRAAAGAAGRLCAGAHPQLQRRAQAGQPDAAAGAAAGARRRAGAGAWRQQRSGPGDDRRNPGGDGLCAGSDRRRRARRLRRAREPAFMPIETLAPKMARLLALRRILGVRNSTHTLVKILQPFDGPALRLVSYTHPEYLEMLGEYFTTAAPAGARRRLPDARHRRRNGGQRQPRPADRLVPQRRAHPAGAARRADRRAGRSCRRRATRPAPPRGSRRRCAARCRCRHRSSSRWRTMPAR